MIAVIALTIAVVAPASIIITTLVVTRRERVSRDVPSFDSVAESALRMLGAKGSQR